MRRASAIVLFLLAAAALASDTGTHDSYVLRDGDVTYMLGEGMSAAALKRLQTRFGRVFLWARREGATYVIRDDDTLDAARGVMQRNVLARTEQERRIAAVVDSAIRRGTARPVDVPRRADGIERSVAADRNPRAEGFSGTPGSCARSRRGCS